MSIEVKPIKLFDTIREAKEILRRELDDPTISEIKRLEWFRDVMRAELTLAYMPDNGEEVIENVISSFEESFRQAEAMLEYYQEALADANKEYNSLLQKAQLARHTRMRTWFVNMPDGLKASELASWDERTGWLMEVLY